MRLKLSIVFITLVLCSSNQIFAQNKNEKDPVKNKSIKISEKNNIKLSEHSDIRISDLLDYNFEELDKVIDVRDYIRGVRRPIRRTRAEDAFLKKLAISVSVGSTHFGVDVATPINEKFKIRAGLGIMPSIIGVNDKISINDPGLNTKLGYIAKYKVKFKPQYFTGRILVDYYPLESIPFHVTAGLYIGENKIKSEGHLINPDTGEKSVLLPQYQGDPWPSLKVDENYIVNIDNGVLNTKLKMGWIVKPYLGVGYGYVIPKSRWGFNVDLGMLYQHKYKVYQFGKEAPKSLDNDVYESQAVIVKKYKNLMRFYPALNVQVTYRVF